MIFVFFFLTGVRRMVCSVLIPGLVDPLRPAALLFLVEVCSVFVAGVWEVELLVVNGLSSVEAWFSTALDIEEVLSGTGGGQLDVMVADVIHSVV